MASIKSLASETQARRILDRVILLARSAKGAAAVATLSAEASGNTRFAVNEITSSGDVERLTLSVTIQYGQRAATATTNQLDDRAIDDVVARARRMAKLAPENPELMPGVDHIQVVTRTPEGNRWTICLHYGRTPTFGQPEPTAGTLVAGERVLSWRWRGECVGNEDSWHII